MVNHPDPDFLAIEEPELDFSELPQPSADLGIEGLKRVVGLIEELERRKLYGGIHNWFQPGTPYGIDRLPKHRAFFKATATYKEVAAFACNRGGKTVAGGFAMACFLTGEYPSWWEGRKFDTNINAWACAASSQKARETVQKELLGEPGKLGTGLIPADKIVRVWAKQGVPNAIDMAEIKHACGRNSLIGFKGYEQKLPAFYGTAQHVIWCDEEPPELIYNECLIRTMTTSGLVYTTCTPLQGVTPFILSFSKVADHLEGAERVVISQEDEEELEKLNKTRQSMAAVVQWGWDDCPWLSQEEKDNLLSRTPDNLKEARRSGKPAVGSGNVYPYPLEELLVDPFQIPDSWRRLYGLDVGFRNTAAVFGAIDPNTDILYLYDEYLGQNKSPSENAEILRKKQDSWIPGVVDPASLTGSQQDGTQLFYVYRDLGLNLFLANNSVATGIETVRERIISGKFKVFKTLRRFREEYMLYQYDRNNPGRVVKSNDHLMDAWRYLVMSIKVARPRLEEGTFTGDSHGSGRRYF